MTIVTPNRCHLTFGQIIPEPGGSLEEVEYALEQLKIMRHWFEEHNEVVRIQGDPMRDWANLKVLKQRSAVDCPDQGAENLHNQEKEHG
jgi:hypothetical protein